jgi:hypothetical protein
MNIWTQYCIKLLLLLAVFLTSTASLRANATNATATYTDSMISPGVFQYDLTLQNTGTTNIGTFWFSWIPGAGFMPATPSSVLSPAGWSDLITNGGGSIQWTTGSPLAAGGSLTSFQFDSTVTPANMAGVFPGPGLGTGDAITTSFIYIGAPFGDPGAQIVATPAAVGVTPEPGTMSLAAIAIVFLGISGIFRKRTISI